MRSRVKELESFEAKALANAKELSALQEWQTQAKLRIEELSKVHRDTTEYLKITFIWIG